MPWRGTFPWAPAAGPSASLPAAGQLCLGGILGRIPGVLASGARSRFAQGIDTQRSPQSILTAAQAGETWFFQAWFRAANPVPSANFSDAVGFAFG